MDGNIREVIIQVLNLILVYNINYILWLLIIERVYNIRQIVKETINIQSQIGILVLVALGYSLSTIFKDKSFIIMLVVSIILIPIIRKSKVDKKK